MKRVILIVAILLLVGTLPAIAGRSLGSVSGEEIRPASTVNLKTLALYDPDPSRKAWFNSHEFIVALSRTSKNGEQTDVIRRGNFDKELLIGRDGKIHVRRCGNVVYAIGVQENAKIRNGRDGRDGRDGIGLDGAPGPEGPRGPRGPRGAKGDALIIEVTPSQMPMMAVTGYPQPYGQSITPGAAPLQGFSYQGDINVAGGTGGSVGNITSNNTNVNTMSQQQILAYKSKNVKGTVVTKGVGASGNKNQRLPAIPK